jgi:aminodeoxyfutalosine synthase
VILDPTSGDDLAAALAEPSPAADAALAALCASTDILSLAMAADDRRRALHGTEATFVRVFDLTAFPAEGDVAIPPAAREIRVPAPQGFDPAEGRRLQRLVVAAGSVPVTVGSVADLEAAAADGRGTLGDLAAWLRDAGVQAIAEAPIDALPDPAAACEAVCASGLTIARATCTRTLDTAGRLAYFRRVLDVHRAVGLRSVAPLARRWNAAAPSTGYEDVRVVALTRLLLPAVPSVQVDWSLYGPKLAQVALTMGADDVDAVTSDDDAPDGRRRAPLEEVLRNIRAAGLTPCERDGAYRRLAG